MKNIKTGTYFNYANDETYNFEFATDLSAHRKLMFVNYVVNSIIDEDRYDYIVKDLIFDFGLIFIMTDINTSFINQTDDDNNPINPIIFIEQFLEDTNVVDIVKANMEVGLLDELNDAVDKSIEYRTGIHPSPIADSLASLLSTLEKKIGEVDLSSAMEMAQKFAGMTDEFNMDNIMKAYMDSDIHKINLEEIAKAKTERTEIAENLDKAIKEVNEENKTKKKSTKSKSKKIHKEETETKVESEVEESEVKVNSED